MPRYIDAEKIKYTEYINGDVTVSKDLVEKIPTADVREVRRGRWERTVPTPPKSYRRICSVCCGVAYMIGKKYSYCPYCGAKMDLEEKENG